MRGRSGAVCVDGLVGALSTQLILFLLVILILLLFRAVGEWTEVCVCVCDVVNVNQCEQAGGTVRQKGLGTHTGCAHAGSDSEIVKPLEGLLSGLAEAGTPREVCKGTARMTQ